MKIPSLMKVVRFSIPNTPLANLKIFPIERLTTEQLKWDIEGCLKALYNELCQRNIYKTNYTCAKYSLSV